MIREHNQVAIGALAADSGVLFPAIAVTEDFRMLKTEIYATATRLTAGSSGELLLGLADAELSLAEVEEALQVNGPLDRNDRLNFERATRPVWIIGMIDGDATAEKGTTAPFRGADGGMMCSWKKRWTFSAPEGFNLFIYNKSDDAVVDSAIAHAVATHYGVWVT